ncbi:hypothetical protein [Neobacillus massiliamazoniensis]|uniref:Uncharacterized protein n=1 Tax=Neobacillus massiliamazoniensis TaxID=1499688 RepID=A0A0U1P3M4_9BACI|nr:hypothetical protein [Neobacillus massiliamazoniensis]CRK84723.1 hypothetical protein BN000_04770 [Neobacillus massiliamazoniensis]
MENTRIYRTSWRIIISFMGVGILFFLMCILAIPTGISFPLILGFLFSFTAIFLGLYDWKNRRKGKGYYWDEEGVVVNFKGNKVYWNEIEKIEFLNRRGKTTVIYPRYNCQETIMKRHKKYVPAKGYAIVWFDIEDPNEFHSKLIRAWNRKKSL